MPTNNSWNSPYLTANGQLLIGSAGNEPVAATITAGSNTTIINGAGSISVNFSNNSTTLAWTDVTSTGQSCTASNGYISDNASPVNMSLPAVCNVGDDIRFANNNTGGFNILPAGGQNIIFYVQNVTYPQYLVTTSSSAAAHLVCTKANSAWNIISHEGTFTTPLLVAFIGATSMFLRHNGSAWATGYNNSGQLGNNTTTNYSSPISVVGNHSFTQLATGTVWTLALKADGSCWTWGYNNDGQLGNNSTTSYSSPISVVGNHSFIQIAANYSANFSLALKADGSAWGWAVNDGGQLGNNTTTNYSSPIAVVGNHSFIQITTGTSSYGLKANGSCWAWGGNGYGELGNNTTTNYSSPISVVGNHSFIQIAAGGSGGANICGLKADGSCWAWGINDYGQLGNNTRTNYSSPISVVGNHSFIQITVQFTFCFGLKAAGSCWSWGENTSGQLGNNTTISYSSPISVVGNISFSKLNPPTGSNCGSAFQANGNLWGWGRNLYGGLNNNISGNSYSSPILIVNIFS